jgi:hypothetical protein
MSGRILTLVVYNDWIRLSDKYNLLVLGPLYHVRIQNIQSHIANDRTGMSDKRSNSFHLHQAFPNQRIL